MFLWLLPAFAVWVITWMKPPRSIWYFEGFHPSPSPNLFRTIEEGGAKFSSSQIVALLWIISSDAIWRWVFISRDKTIRNLSWDNLALHCSHVTPHFPASLWFFIRLEEVGFLLVYEKTRLQSGSLLWLLVLFKDMVFRVRKLLWLDGWFLPRRGWLLMQRVFQSYSR